MFYPYRTTTDKLEESQRSVRESGDQVLAVHFQGGRDWILVCRKGSCEPVLEMDARRLKALIADAVEAGVRRANRDGMSRRVVGS